VVGEVEHTSDGGYERTGFSEAVLYRFEYGDRLSGWLKSVLVVPGPVAGAARMRDPTIAVGWARWVPDVVVAGLLEGVPHAGSAVDRVGGGIAASWDHRKGSARYAAAVRR
jgi:hypothetical protein